MSDNPMNKEVLRLNTLIVKLRREVRQLKRQTKLADGEKAYQNILALENDNTELEQELAIKDEKIEELQQQLKMLALDIIDILKEYTK